MKLSEKLATILASNDPNSILFSFSNLTLFVENQIKELSVAKDNIVLNELKRIAETVLQNYLKNLGFDFNDATNTKELLLKVNTIIDANLDDFLEISMRPTAYGIETEKNMLKISILKEIINNFSAVIGLAKEPSIVPLLFTGGRDENQEEIRKLREIIEKEKMTLLD